MAHRTFMDLRGDEWQVWEVDPSALLETTPEAATWLVFQSPGEKRRLAPVPPGWADVPEAELVRLLARATPVQSRLDLPEQGTPTAPATVPRREEPRPPTE